METLNTPMGTVPLVPARWRKHDGVWVARVEDRWEAMDDMVVRITRAHDGATTDRFLLLRVGDDAGASLWIVSEPGDVERRFSDFDHEDF